MSQTRFITKEYLDVFQRLFPDRHCLECILSYFQPALLKDIHPHPRDKRIKFYDEVLLDGEMEPRYHLYIVDGDPNSYISSTTFIHSFFEHFDADAVISNMMRGRNWQTSPYFGMTPDQIKNQWEENRDQAARKGTAMHLNLEHFYNGIPVDTEFLSTKEWEQFQRYLQKHRYIDTDGKEYDLQPHLTEAVIFDEEHKVTGSVDWLGIDPKRPGYLILKDWKRSKEIKWYGFKRGQEPLTHLYDCNGMHYTLQASLYRWILERNYGVKISGMFLVRFHPDADDFEEIRVGYLKDEIEAMMAHRLAQLKGK